MVAARLAERLLGLASTMILARLLVPADFGLVAMAMVFVAAADLLGAFGLDWALVRQPGIERRHLDTAWTIRAGLGLASLFVLVALAVPAATFYREPRITPIILLLGVSLLVGSLENPGVIMFRREMNFSKEFQLRTVAKIAGALVAVCGAVALRSYWALLWGALVSRGAATIMSYVVHPHRPRPTLEAREELLSFSIWLWAGNILTFLRLRALQLVLGRIVGPRDLGLFAVSGEFADLASTELAAPINRALFSAYATKGDPAAVGAAYLQAAPVIWAITLPVVVGTYLAAPQLVHLLLGPQWSDAVPLLRILSLAGMAGLLTSGALHVYWAINRPQLEVLLESLWVVLLLGLVLMLTPARGVEGAALAALISGIMVAPVNVYLLRRYARVSLVRTISLCWRILAGCTTMFGLVSFVVGDPAVGSGREALLQLLVMTAVGAPTYVCVVLALWFLAGRPDGPEATMVRVAARRIGRGRVAE